MNDNDDLLVRAEPLLALDPTNSYQVDPTTRQLVADLVAELRERDRQLEAAQAEGKLQRARVARARLSMKAVLSSPLCHQHIRIQLREWIAELEDDHPSASVPSTPTTTEPDDG